jgi:DNA-binding NtrC family response regulator
LVPEAIDAPPLPGLGEVGQRVLQLSLSEWGPSRGAEMIGLSPPYLQLLAKLLKISGFHEPVLITGESGVGKESIAQALYLLSPRRGREFVAVNCPQYQEGNLTVSELFGHKKGSFTGAVADRKGCFELADGGVIFLDEIADLHMSAQLMLLRALSTGEFHPLGETTVRRVNVRVVAATNRPLNQLVANQQFRHDLLFRLRYFQLEVPPLRERGDDWRLLLDHYLRRLHRRYGVAKSFSEEALGVLERYRWPGNVRELMGIVSTGYALSDGDTIEIHDILDRLEQYQPGPENDPDELFRRLSRRSGDFWTLVHDPYMDRDLARRDVRRLIARGLSHVEGSYRRLLSMWHIPSPDYKRFMDFLRHHRLQPSNVKEDGE